jgi:hypothetical protein
MHEKAESNAGTKCYLGTRCGAPDMPEMGHMGQGQQEKVAPSGHSARSTHPGTRHVSQAPKPRGAVDERQTIASHLAFPPEKKAPAGSTQHSARSAQPGMWPEEAPAAPRARAGLWAVDEPPAACCLLSSVLPARLL